MMAMAPQPDDDENLLGDSRWPGFLALIVGLLLIGVTLLFLFLAMILAAEKVVADVFISNS